MCYSGNHCQMVKEASVFGFVCKYHWAFAPHMSEERALLLQCLLRSYPEYIHVHLCGVV